MFRSEHVKIFENDKGRHYGFVFACNQGYTPLSEIISQIMSFHCLKEWKTQKQSSSQLVAAAMTAMLIACASALFANCVFLTFVGRSVYLRLEVLQWVLALTNLYLIITKSSESITILSNPFKMYGTELRYNKQFLSSLGTLLNRSSTVMFI